MTMERQQSFLFLHPHPPISKGFVFAKQAHQGLHYGIAVLAQMARDEGHNVKVLSYSSLAELNKFLKNNRYDWVLTTSFTNQLSLTCDTLKFLAEKIPHAKVVIGGVHASFCPESFADYPYDFLVRGEGEIFLKKLLSGDDFSTLPGVFKKGEEITGEFVPLIQDLDSLPLPFRYLKPSECSRRLDILTGRGCPFSCSYCVNGS